MKTRASDDSTSNGANEGWAVFSTLLGGLLVWGAIGWLLDHWWHTHVATPIGFLLGMVLGIYAVVARYGRAPVPTVSTRPSNQSPWVAPFESRLIRQPDDGVGRVDSRVDPSTHSTEKESR